MVGRGGRGTARGRDRFVEEQEIAGSGTSPRAVPRQRSSAPFWIALAVACAVGLGFHADAWARAERPFLADSIEYLLMARHPITGDPMPVKPVRSGFFALLLALPLGLRNLFAPAGAALDNAWALAIPLAFALLATLGAWRLGRAVGGPRLGPWIGLLAAFVTALLPEVTHESSDFLTDVPAAACTVWAVALWFERRPFGAGLSMALAVALRYQSLISLGALSCSLVWRTARERALRPLLRASAGIALGAIVLGSADAFMWGRAFQSFLVYVPRQLTTFLPLETVRRFWPAEALQQMSAGPVNASLEQLATREWSFYLERAPVFFGWPVLLGLVAYPFVRRHLERPRGTDLALWITLANVLALSAQRFKETRYLIAVAPLVATIAAAGLVVVADRLARGSGAARGRLMARVGPAFVLLAVLAFTRHAWSIQSALHYAPFGATISAVQTIPVGARPARIAVPRPWVLTYRFPLKGLEKHAWKLHDFHVLDLAEVHGAFSAAPGTPAANLRPLLDGLDYIVIEMPTVVNDDWSRWRWINEHMRFDGLFFDPIEDRQVVMRFARREATEASALWEIDEPRARLQPVQAIFASMDTEGAAVFEIQLVGLEARIVPTSPTAVTFDARWRLPELADTTLVAEALVLDQDGGRLGGYRDLVLPKDAEEHLARSGRALRISNAQHLARRPGDLRVLLRLTSVQARSQGLVVEQLEARGAEVLEGEGGSWLSLNVKVLPPLVALDEDSHLSRGPDPTAE